LEKSRRLRFVLVLRLIVKRLSADVSEYTT
jgi:hypothetical protein